MEQDSFVMNLAPAALPESSLFPKIEINYRVVRRVNRTLGENIRIKYFASYDLTASHSFVLKIIGFNWDIIDEKIDPEKIRIYWEYGGGWGYDSYFIEPLFISFGSSFIFKIRDFVETLGVIGKETPDTAEDSVVRQRIHNLLEHYSTAFVPFEINFSGAYLMSTSDSLSFSFTHLDSFVVEIDTTEA